MMPTPSSIDHGSTDQECDVESAGHTLLRVASTARYFRSADGCFHARVRVEDRHETYGLKSLEFRDWLIERYRGERSDLPPANAVARVVRAVAARARFDGGTPVVHVRVGCDGDGGGSDFYIDLGDRTGQAIKISTLE